MFIELEDVQVECIIGELPAERAKKQILYVNVRMEVDEKASLTDDMEDTVDYCEVVENIRRNLERAKCRMIERAAKIVCDTCMEFPKVRLVKAEILKKGVVKGLKSAKAVMETKRGENSI